MYELPGKYRTLTKVSIMHSNNQHSVPLIIYGGLQLSCGDCTDTVHSWYTHCVIGPASKQWSDVWLCVALCHAEVMCRETVALLPPYRGGHTGASETFYEKR